MHKFSRQKILLKKIQEKEFTPINDLITFVQNTYSFTAITVRRDLKEIAKEGHIKLLHGGIKYINKTQSQIKLLDIDNNKIFLATKTNELINNNDILFINSGITNEYLISLINKPVYLFTNSIEIFKQAINNKNILDTILIGGRYLAESKVLVGSHSLANLENVKFSKCILNIKNISNTYDLYAKNEEEAQLKQKVLSASNTKIIIAENDSINTIGFIKYANLKECDIFITNNKSLPNINEIGNSIIVIN